MLERARGIRPDDQSDAAKIGRQVQGWGDFDQLRFVAIIGVRPPQNGYVAQNIIKAVITPENKNWTRPEQIDRDRLAQKPASQAPTQPAAGAISRPDWAK
jgi:hypothetical protein